MLKQKDDGNSGIDEDFSKEDKYNNGDNLCTDKVQSNDEDTAYDSSKDGVQSKNNIKTDNEYKEGPKGDVTESKMVREKIPKKMKKARLMWVTLGLAFYFSL
jgi:hypothetical protein